MNLVAEVEQVLLEMIRLNDDFNFTRQAGETIPPPLSWSVTRYAALPASGELGMLLRAVTVYGALSRGAGIAKEYYNEDPQWLFTFNRIGESLFFRLPADLNSFDQTVFHREASKAFVVGWRGDSLPSLP